MSSPGTRLLLFVLLIIVILPAASPAQQGAKDDEYLIRGLIRDGLYEVASDKIFDFVFKYPSHPRREKMLFDITQTLIKKDSFNKAVPLLRCYLQEFPEGRWRRSVKIMLARALYSAGSYSQATPLLDEIINDSGQRTADRLDAKEMLADIYFSQGRNEDARVLLVEKSPKGSGPRIRLILARNLIKLQLFGEAENLLKNLVSRRRKDETWHEAREELISLYLSLSRYQECVELLNTWKVKEEDKYSERDRKIALALSISYYHLGDYDLAYAYIKPIFQTSIAQQDTATQLPSVLFALKEWTSVAAILESSFQNEVDTLRKIEIGNRLILALQQDGNYEKAILTIRKVATLYSDPDMSATTLLKALQLQVMPEERIKTIEEAIAMQPVDRIMARLHYLHGLELAKAGQLSPAQTEWKKSLVAYPKSEFAPEALQKIAEIDIQRGNLEAAVESLARIVSQYPGSDLLPLAQQKLIAVDFSLKRWSDVLETFEVLQRSISPDSVTPDTYRRAAIAAQNKGEHKTASDLILYAYLASSSAEPKWFRDFKLLQLKSLGNLDILEDELEALRNKEKQEGRNTSAICLINSYNNSSQWQKGFDLAIELINSSSDAIIRNWARYQASVFAGKLGSGLSSINYLNSIIADKQAGAYSQLAVKELQRISLAKGDYGSLLQSDPAFLVNSPVSMFSADQSLKRARNLYNSGQYEAALKIFNGYPDLKNLMEDDLYYFSMSLFHTGAIIKAQGIFQLIDPEAIPAPWSWNGERLAAEYYSVTGDRNKAYDCYKTLLNKPIPAEMRMSLLTPFATLAEKLGKWPEAKLLYQEFVEKAGRSEQTLEVLEGVAGRYMAHGEYNDAMTLLAEVKRATTDSEKRVTIEYQLADLIRRTKGDEAGIDAYLSIAYQNPDLGNWPAKARLQAGRLYEKTGNSMAAERQYKLVAENWPGSAEAKAAARRLFELANIRTEIKEEQIQ